MNNSSNYASNSSQLDKKQIVRLWFRLLKNTCETERYLRTQLHNNFASTLPQFELLAALYHAKNRSAKLSFLNK